MSLQIKNISHACLRYQINDKIIITDPWIEDMPIKAGMIYRFPKKNIKIQDIVKNVDLCYISHTHEDHFHVPSILNFHKQTKFLIPDFSYLQKGRRGNLMEDTLIALGYKNIIKLKPWEKLKFDQDTELQIIPSAKSRYFDWENSGLAVSYKSKTFLNMNDNIVDSELCKEIIKNIGRIFTYFVQTAGISTHPACFKMSEEDKKKQIKNKAENFSLHDLIVKEINPDYLIPYAGDFGWFGKHQKFSHWSRTTPMPLLNHLKNKNIKTFEFLPNDDVSIIDNELVHEKNNKEIDWNDYQGIIDKHEKFYEQIIKDNETKINNYNISDIYENALKYVKNLNEVNEDSEVKPWFNASMAYCIFDNKISNKIFFLVVKAAQEGQYNLSIEKTLKDEVHQIHYLDAKIFMSILKGDSMLNEVQWRSIIEEIKPFDNDIRDLLFYNGYHIDGDNRTPQIQLRKIYQI